MQRSSMGCFGQLEEAFLWGNGSSGDTWIWHFDAKGTYKFYWTLNHFPPPTKMPMCNGGKKLWNLKF